MNKSTWIIPAFLFVGLMVSIIGYLGSYEHIKKQSSPLDNALISVQMDGWGINSDNNKEVLFDFYIYNFGTVEAKDIEITCIEVQNGKRINEIKKQLGNIASSSYQFFEVKNIKNEYWSIDNNGGCYISNSTNAVNLMQNLKEYKELVNS